MLPAKGGASPEAMLLVSMPTGFCSMKLLYMVQAEFKQKHKFTKLLENLVALHLKLTLQVLSSEDYETMGTLATDM